VKVGITVFLLTTHLFLLTGTKREIFYNFEIHARPLFKCLLCVLFFDGEVFNVFFYHLFRQVLKLIAKPVESLVQTIAGGGTSALGVPSSLAEVVEAQFVSHFGGRHGVWKILFVCENEKNGVPEFVFVEHSHEFLPGLADSVPIVTVDDEDEALCVLEVVPPERSNFVLSADVPHGEADVLVFDCFHIETNSGNSGNDLAQFQFVENGGFTRCVKTDHQDSHFLLAEEASKNREIASHTEKPGYCFVLRNFLCISVSST